MSDVARRGSKPDQELAARRLALQLAVQLPDDAEKALRVLKLTEHLIRSFLNGGPIQS